MTIEPPSPANHAQIEALLDEAFGADRHRRTVYRLREGEQPLAGMTFVARDNGRVIGSIQCWPVQLVQPSRHTHPLTLLGPVAVAVDRHGEGIGAALIEAALAGAGDTPVMLIGDAPYYGRFGFTAEHTREWALPGPVERKRLLARCAARLPRVAEVRPAAQLSWAA